MGIVHPRHPFPVVAVVLESLVDSYEPLVESVLAVV